ncbi:MAG: UDP-galactopyranose mutase [Lentisphaerae bacterium]|nr:UDP-galactopyranose mutase [Lentisphaerota bacterium]
MASSNGSVVVSGAGIWGCTLARVFAEAGMRVVVLESRAAIGGNCRCAMDPATGIEVHLYGSHIFHTANREVWDFANRFTEFNGYRHKVLARHAGRTYFLPLGLALVNSFFGVELTPSELPAFMAQAGRRDAIFDAFFRNYTSKQWGRAPEDIDPSIINRVPVRVSYDVNYFNDTLQGIPRDGYNAFFERLVDHPLIEVRCGSAFSLDSVDALRREFPDATAFFHSGAIDALFGYRFGALPWRTLRFETETQDVVDAQGTSVVNYVDADVPFTRIHEYKHYHPENAAVMSAPRTIVCREYPKTWEGGDEPYYPVVDDDSRALLAKYRSAVEDFNARISPVRLVVGGRLGGFAYFDMDKAMADAISTAKAHLASRRP